MPKNNFLLVNLNEPKTKKLAETITSETSRKILNQLVEKEETEANLANILSLPISTVHYHLQKLLEAGLVTVEEFHYSPKGREVNHYKLANKYIIIAPGSTVGLKEKLKGILPVALIATAISAVIKFTQSSLFTGITEQKLMASVEMAKTVPLMADASSIASSPATSSASLITSSPPDMALWFFLGSMVALGLYLLIMIVKEWWQSKR